jgi:hypothetical protein
MVDLGVVVDMLLARNHIQPIQNGFGPLPHKNRIHIVPYQATSQGDGTSRKITTPALAHL